MSSSDAPATHVWPLVGRDQELGRIATARADLACPGVVISGSAGVGRTRLAREACAAAEQAGALTYWVQGTGSAAAIPLRAFAALIPDDVRADEPLELIRRSTERVAARAAGRKVCVGVDDAHLLDPASAALVLHLATAAGVFVVVTVGAGEAAPDAIDSLWNDAGAVRIKLRRLDDEAIQGLVETALDGPVEAAVLRRVVDASAGNALYARELILGAIDDGRLRLDRGLWRLKRSGVSLSLAALVTRRMGVLDERTAGSLRRARRAHRSRSSSPRARRAVAPPKSKPMIHHVRKRKPQRVCLGLLRCLLLRDCGSVQSRRNARHPVGRGRRLCPVARLVLSGSRRVRQRFSSRHRGCFATKRSTAPAIGETTARSPAGQRALGCCFAT
jgi:AAA ATPase domain